MEKINAKIRITGTLRLLSGLHIGTSNAFSAIGATDAPIIKDPLTNKPIIPGSSIKGKLRTLLAQTKNDTVAHSPNEDHEIIRRLFGDTEEFKRAQLIFRDLFLSNESDLVEMGARLLTEVKFENTINRINATATPRQIERSIAGSEFQLDLIYNVQQLESVVTDIEFLLDGFRLLEMDYLGGNGSRGYGRIEFDHLNADVVFGELDKQQLENINTLLATI